MPDHSSGDTMTATAHDLLAELGPATDFADSPCAGGGDRVVTVHHKPRDPSRQCTAPGCPYVTRDPSQGCPLHRREVSR